MASLFGSMSNNSQNKKARSFLFFFFWNRSTTTDFQVDVHVLSSIQHLDSLPASYETHTDTVVYSTGIN